jgi:magnesium chelatase family protein
MLAATDQLHNGEQIANYIIMGELSLDGEVRPIKGALPYCYPGPQGRI